MSKNECTFYLYNWFIPSALLVLSVMFLNEILTNTTSYALVSSVLIIAHYIYIIFRLEATLSKAHRFDMLMVPFIYMLMLVIIATLFSISLTSINSFLDTGGSISSFDYFYYCMISLTSVGYGDLSPGTTADKIFAISMSLLGTLHMVMFISVVVGKLTTLARKS
ncbi:hypothetical protein VagYM19_12100 [Vibrio alginolyticus]|nr:hypothetical protein Vag1382_12090 [Vibrio alginolyticus]BCB46683.1 hypothetical protein VagVIO5_12090 [Vibrio alginolyticus]BCB51284.1 hypothetical protein VagYM19_12100 [Vibrio alginolyticus]BCB55887.1 hypothetical protein VagYM4_12100 [Vibrio alginolyticus]